MKSVGGSMVSRILGLSKWGGPVSAYMELTADTEPPRSEAMGRGKALEASVLGLWAQEEGVFLLPGERKVRPERSPHAHATLDALALLSLEDGPMVIAEAKTLAREQAGKEWGEPGTDRVAREYLLQAQWYMGVSLEAGLEVLPEVAMPVLVGPEAELAWAARMVERSGRALTAEDMEGTGLSLRVYRIDFDAEFYDWMDCQVRRFLVEHVQAGVPPQPSEGDVLMERDLHAVAHGLRGRKGEALDFDRLSPVRQTPFLELLEAVRQRRAWEQKEEQIRARVQLALGGAEEIRGLPGGARVTWKTTKAGSRRFEVREPKS